MTQKELEKFPSIKINNSLLYLEDRFNFLIAYLSKEESKYKDVLESYLINEGFKQSNPSNKPLIFIKYY